MDNAKTGWGGRLLWTVAGVLLLLVWVASMSLDDDQICSSVPLCFGFGVVLLLAVMGMVAGGRPARPSLTALVGLCVGIYFLVCCVSGDMLSEIGLEIPLILAAFVFYGAGFLLAQRSGETALTVALTTGILVNVAYFFLLPDPSVPVESIGRPAMGLGGANSKGCALFFYRNFAALFLMLAGFILILRPVWAGKMRWSSLLPALVGMVGVACSCMCGSRSVLALPVLILLAGWVLWVLIRLGSGQGIGYGAVISGVLLLIGVGVLLGELFMGNELLRQIVSIDTHGRTRIWQAVYSLLPDVPWCGHGAGAGSWLLVPFLNMGGVPNYVHNEYLQAWVDYGVVGLILMLSVILSHLASGFWSLASEDIGRERRVLVAACMTLLLSFSASALFDFVWHNVALVGLNAFACGVLASPVPTRSDPIFGRRRWAAGHGPTLRPVRFVGASGAALCCVACTALMAASACFAWSLLPAWRAQWEYNALCHAGASNAERVEFLERVVPLYPDPDVADHYVTLRPPAERRDNVTRKETVLRLALQSNPRQLYIVSILAETLGWQGRYDEAEALLRDHYPPDGPPTTWRGNWPGYYGMNLLRWGQQRMQQGDYASALSMMEYALKLCGHAYDFSYRSSSYIHIAQARNRIATSFLAARRVDVDMLRAIGVEKDDSWMKPLRSGGSPALYQRWLDEPRKSRARSPYIRGKWSPFNDALQKKGK